MWTLVGNLLTSVCIDIGMYTSCAFLLFSLVRAPYKSEGFHLSLSLFLTCPHGVCICSISLPSLQPLSCQLKHVTIHAFATISRNETIVCNLTLSVCDTFFFFLCSVDMSLRIYQILTNAEVGWCSCIPSASFFTMVLSQSTDMSVKIIISLYSAQALSVSLIDQAPFSSHPVLLGLCACSRG